MSELDLVDKLRGWFESDPDGVGPWLKAAYCAGYVGALGGGLMPVWLVEAINSAPDTVWAHRVDEAWIAGRVAGPAGLNSLPTPGDPDPDW